MFTMGAAAGVLGIILVPIGFIFSVIMIRVYLEIVSVLFNIYEEIKLLTQKAQPLVLLLKQGAGISGKA